MTIRIGVQCQRHSWWNMVMDFDHNVSEWPWCNKDSCSAGVHGKTRGESSLLLREGTKKRGNTYKLQYGQKFCACCLLHKIISIKTRGHVIIWSFFRREERALEETQGWNGNSFCIYKFICATTVQLMDFFKTLCFPQNETFNAILANSLS